MNTKDKDDNETKKLTAKYQRQVGPAAQKWIQRLNKEEKGR